MTNIFKYVLSALCSAFLGILSLMQHLMIVIPVDPNERTDFEKLVVSLIDNRIWFWVLIAAIVILMFSTISDSIKNFKRRQKHHKFKVKSKKFFNFFSKWYKQTGKLIIICDDLDWTHDNDNYEIINALKEKCKQGLLLYLGNPEDAIAKELESHGAKLHKAKEEVISQYSFSCLSPMGNYSNIIVRKKSEDNKQEVEFEELKDKFVINLLIASLDDRMDAIV